MTQQIETPQTRPEPTPPEPANSHSSKRSWWRRPWILPLALVVAAVLLYIWPHYIGLDRSRATVALPPTHPLKYPLLVLHITFGSLALIAVLLQLWPRLRQRRPAVHRTVGRIYVFGAVLPSALLAAVLISYLGGPGWIGRIVLNILWVTTTLVGFRMARQRRWVDHRRFMIFSFALTMDAFSTRVLSFSLPRILGPNLDPIPVIEAVAWLGWMANLLIAFWWLERSRKSQRNQLIVA
jgi:uncharacterized membrane protein YozB (DUF420 family)